MGTLTEANPNARELATEILDETRWWSALRLIVEFLRAKKVENVRIKFGFVIDRDLEGQITPPDEIVSLVDLERRIKIGREEGTIERNAGSDFVFYAQGSDLVFMLCNDSDVHFASTDSTLLSELGHKLSSGGIKVYDSGKAI